MRLRDLDGKRVVVWGCGREAAAFVRAITVDDLNVEVTVIDEGVTEPTLTNDLNVLPFDETLLRAADYVVRSPGVSIYRPELVGVNVITPTGLWFAEERASTIVITGTKGKSTTAALVAHLLCELGVNARLAGNIGRPPLDFVNDDEPDWWVLELSSFQIADLDAEPDIAVLTSLDSDHLDWHGSQENYVKDKLHVFENARKRVVNAADPGAASVLARIGDAVHVDGSGPVPPSQLFGPHNQQLIRLALAVLREVGIDVDARAYDIATALSSFAPLPHRLEPVAEINEVLYVNDSLSTNPIATTAAVNAFSGRPVSLLVGGYDRGLDFTEFAAFLSAQPNLHVYTMPDCGKRIAESVTNIPVTHTGSLEEAVELASENTPAGGVVLMSPAAASFGRFHDYAERGEAFRKFVKR